MTNANHSQAAAQPVYIKFAERLNVLRSQCRSFAACVRREYADIEQAIEEGVPLELIVRELSEHYNVQGSLAALKSALSRIRKVREGEACQRWLDRNAPVGSGGGTSGGLTAAAPMANPSMQSGLGQQPHASFPNGAPQHFHGAPQSLWGLGQPPQSVHHSGWPAPFPPHGGGPQWQSFPGAGYNGFGGA